MGCISAKPVGLHSCCRDVPEVEVTPVGRPGLARLANVPTDRAARVPASISLSHQMLIIWLPGNNQMVSWLFELFYSPM